MSKRNVDHASELKARAAPVLIKVLEFFDSLQLSNAERVIVAEALAHKSVSATADAGVPESVIVTVGRLGVDLAHEIRKVAVNPTQQNQPGGCACGVYHDEHELPKALRDRAGREAKKALKRIVGDM